MNMFEGNNESLEEESVERLRRILEDQQGRVVTYNEALNVGSSLLSFYRTLADQGVSKTETVSGM